MRKWGLLLLIALFVLGGHQAQENDTYIAFVSNREANDDIYVTNLSGTQVYNLTQSRSRNWHPTWSSDGTRIAYNSDQDDNAEIYVMNNNGTEKTNVSNHAASDTSPDWSPVADEIVFVSDRDGGYDLYILMLEDGSVRRLTMDGSPKSEPDWSPDGAQITFWQQVDEETAVLNVLNVASGTVTTLIDSGQNLWPAWSPDGSHIAFFSTASGTADIYSVDVASGEITNISNNDSNDARPAWSADGTQIVYMSNQNGNYDLFVMNADGSGEQMLVNAPENDLSADWQPVATPIDFDSAALGQNVNIVQGAIDTNSQEELGSGTRRLFAPETVFAEDVIRVRFEIELDALSSDATPQSTPDIPLRDERGLTVYRYMGAELTGLDLSRFEVFPTPSGYVLQVREDGVNYWEWMLRPLIPDAVGQNFLAVRVYLPEVQADGAIVRTELEVIPFDIEVVTEETGTESEYVQESLEPENKQGISVFYSDQNVLSVTFTDATNVEDMRIATESVEFPVLMDFPIFAQADNIVPPSTCLYYERQGEEPVLPRACRSGTSYNFPLVAGEIFWYDTNDRQLLDIIIRLNDTALICPAGSDRCDF